MHKILVVDDEERIVKVLEGFLKKAGFDVLSALGGEAALEILRSDVCIDLLIIDMKMPRITGLDVLKEGMSSQKVTSVIILTGILNEEKDHAELTQMGFGTEDIFYKPLDLFILLDAVKKKLERKGLQ